MNKKYLVLARKYRPQSFSEVVGQEAIVTTLKNSIRSGRVAHAYLFCGTRGTGKTTLARLFAKILNCASVSEQLEPCNVCRSCKDIANGNAIDVLEIDGASHRGIEDIRQINETVGFAPSAGKYKIYLIDEVHMLTKEAFNALLKTLEEPPPEAKFFFATTEPHKIPQTILSRCQRFNLGRISTEKIHAKLASIAKDMEIQVADDALITLAEFAEGSLRDAESLFDQVISFQEGHITQQTVLDVLGLPSRETFFLLDEAGSKGKYQVAFEIAKDIFSSGKNISYFMGELLSHFRTLLLIKSGIEPTQQPARYQQSAQLYQEEQLLRILEILNDGQNAIKFAPSERICLEMLLLQILRTHQRISLENLVERLASLENRLKVGTPTQKSESLPPQAQTIVAEKKASIPDPKPDLSSPKNEPILEEKSKHTLLEKSRFDTLMRFAAKELNGSLKTL